VCCAPKTWQTCCLCWWWSVAGEIGCKC
jgi:hypothetical protein